MEEDDDNDNVQEGAVPPSGQTVSLDRAKGCRLWVQQRLIILIRSYNKLDVIYYIMIEVQLIMLTSLRAPPTPNYIKGHGLEAGRELCGSGMTFRS